MSDQVLRRLLAGAWLFLGLACSAQAAAHSRSYSYSLWELDTAPYQLTVRVNQFDLTRLGLHPDYTPEYLDQVGRLMAEGLQASQGVSNCQWQQPRLNQTADGWIVLRASLPCEGAGDLSIHSRLLLDVISSHMHFVTVRDARGQVSEKVLTEAEPRWQLNGAQVTADANGAAATVGSYWMLGMAHILTGWDHLAFVLGLLLLAANLRQLVWLVTGFTLAHSITLVLASLGHVQTVSTAVEAVIGLSILLVAVEHVWESQGRRILLPLLVCGGLLLMALLQPAGVPLPVLLGITLFVACYFGLLRLAGQPQRWRLLIAFAFGLFHGFGFAGILADMSLPEARLLTALFAFNLGVESGQLLVVAVLWPLLAWLGRRLPVEQLCTTVIAGLGTFWFITRAFI